jgi:hypothetical protein
MMSIQIEYWAFHSDFMKDHQCKSMEEANQLRDKWKSEGFQDAVSEMRIREFFPTGGDIESRGRHLVHPDGYCDVCKDTCGN